MGRKNKSPRGRKGEQHHSAAEEGKKKEVPLVEKRGKRRKKREKKSSISIKEKKKGGDVPVSIKKISTHERNNRHPQPGKGRKELPHRKEGRIGFRPGKKEEEKGDIRSSRFIKKHSPTKKRNKRRRKKI